MVTPEEIFEQVYSVGADGWVSKEACLKAMKLYANAKLDQAADNAQIKEKRNNEHWYECLPFPDVDKKSILSLKDKR